MTTLNPGDTTTDRDVAVTVTLDRDLKTGEVVRVFRNDEQIGQMGVGTASSTIRAPITNSDGSDPLLTHKAIYYPPNGAPVESTPFPIVFDDEIRCSIEGVYNPNPVLSFQLVEVELNAGSGSGNSPENGILVTSFPYNTTMDAMDGTIIWYEVRLPSAGDAWTFTTGDSPHPTDYDTFLALFTSTGTLINSNDDINTGGSDYRSIIAESLSAGTYFLALTTYGASVSTEGSFQMTPGDTSVPAGTILRISSE